MINRTPTEFELVFENQEPAWATAYGFRTTIRPDASSSEVVIGPTRQP